MINEKLKDKSIKKYFFGENYVDYLKNIAIFQLLCGVIAGIYIFTSANNLDSLNPITSSLKDFGTILSIVTIISSILIYILIIGVQHILNNSIENRKLLIQLLNVQKEKTQK